MSFCVLLVDDQKAIVESIQSGVDWHSIGVDRVFTACSAMEAKLIITNFEIDLMITDVEMPEESGLELTNWVTRHHSDIGVIFLTAHPDFRYAQEAIRLHVMDYCLQPVRFDQLSGAVAKARSKLLENRTIHSAKESLNLLQKQQNSYFDILVLKALQGQDKEAQQLWDDYRKFIAEDMHCNELTARILMIHIQRWTAMQEKMDNSLIRLIFSNVTDELFHEEKCKSVVASADDNRYWIFMLLPDVTISMARFSGQLQTMYDFFHNQADLQISVYADPSPVTIFGTISNLDSWDKKNISRMKGVFYQNPMISVKEEASDPIAEAIEYIKSHLHQNITRTEIADYVHLNPEYLSRLFRESTGASLKEYILSEKIRQAEKLLEHSHLSIGVIAGKVGFDNLSHFSKTFRIATGKTPQEYRKSKQN